METLIDKEKKEKAVNDGDNHKKPCPGGHGETAVSPKDHGTNCPHGVFEGNLDKYRNITLTFCPAPVSDHKPNLKRTSGVETEPELGGMGIVHESENMENGEHEMEAEKGGEAVTE